MTDAIIETRTILDELVAGKREALVERMAAVPPSSIEQQARNRPTAIALGPALRGPNIGLIAEIKKASPAAGLLEATFHPVDRAQNYVSGGAAAISILTEERRFLGDLEHLRAVRVALDGLGGRRPPLLRKDFLFDPYQVYEARAAGADAILLIVAILAQSTLESLLGLAGELGLSVIVEVHNEQELEKALSAGAQIIGINNRDLRTFATSLEVTERLRPEIPDDRSVISESGVQTTADIERLAGAGVDAILVGEALMRSGDVRRSVEAFSSVPRRKRQ